MPLSPLVAPATALSAAERVRTARHAALTGVGELGQRRLAAAHVAVVGAGGLGSPVVLALAAAGVGTLTVIDDDVVDLSNLQRQVLHRHADVGGAKVSSAVRAAADLSPETTVRGVRERLTAENATRLLAGADVVVDGSDNFATRGAVAQACDELGVPLVWGVLQEFHAQVTVFWSAPPAGVAPVRLTDLYPPETVGEPPSCAAVGVLGALCLQVGGLMAIEAVKLVVGAGETLLGRVLLLDALQATQREVPLRPSTQRVPATPGAGDEATPAPVPPARGSRTDAPDTAHVPVVSADEMLAEQAAGSTILDVREPHETESGVIAGSVVVPLADLLAEPGQVGAGPVVVVCARGGRALQAAEVLRAHGVEASVLDGGLGASTPQAGLVAWEHP